MLIAARLLSGVAECIVVVAALSWGMARLGPEHSGKVIGWIGMALFAAYGLGAPAGSWVDARYGFLGIAFATVLISLVPLALVTLMAGPAPSHLQRPPFYKVVGLVKLPGPALMLASTGYAAPNAFIVLLWAQRGWGAAALAFQGLGVEAVRRGPPESRGAAMGTRRSRTCRWDWPARWVAGWRCTPGWRRCTWRGQQVRSGRWCWRWGWPGRRRPRERLLAVIASSRLATGGPA